MVNYSGREWYIIGSEIIDQKNTLILVAKEPLDNTLPANIANVFSNVFASDQPVTKHLFTSEGTDTAYIPDIKFNKLPGSGILEVSVSEITAGRSNQFSIDISKFANSTKINEHFCWLRSYAGTSDTFYSVGRDPMNNLTIAGLWDKSSAGVLPVINLIPDDILFAADTNNDGVLDLYFMEDSKNPTITAKTELTSGGIIFSGDVNSADDFSSDETLYIMWSDSDQQETKCIVKNLNDLVKKTDYLRDANGDFDGILSPSDIKDIANVTDFEFNEDVRIWIAKQNAEDNCYHAKVITHTHDWIFGVTTTGTEFENDTLIAYCKDNGCNGNTIANPLTLQFNQIYTDYDGTAWSDEADLFYSGNDFQDLCEMLDPDENKPLKLTAKYYCDSALTTPTTPENSGSADEGQPPVDVGQYYVCFTPNYGGKDFPSVSVVVPFEITSSIIEVVNFNGPVNIVANEDTYGIDDLNVVDNNLYTVDSISWQPIPGEKFGFNTEYTATIVFKSKKGYSFTHEDGELASLVTDNSFPDPDEGNWNIDPSSNGTYLTITKTFATTEIAKLKSISAPKVPEIFKRSQDAASQIKDELPTTVAVVTEDENIKELKITWSYDKENYSEEFSDFNDGGKVIENTFIWTIEDDKLTDLNNNNNIPTSGKVIIKNPNHNPNHNPIYEITFPEVKKNDTYVEGKDKDGKVIFKGKITWDGNKATMTLTAEQGFQFDIDVKVLPEGWTLAESNRTEASSQIVLTKEFPEDPKNNNGDNGNAGKKDYPLAVVIGPAGSTDTNKDAGTTETEEDDDDDDDDEYDDTVPADIPEEVLENAAAFLSRLTGTTVSAKDIAGRVIMDKKHNAYYLLIKEGSVPVGEEATADETGTLMYLMPIKQKKTIKVVSKVVINDITYKVPYINDKAFSGLNKIEKLVIGTYVTHIGNKAFSNMNKLATVQFITRKLTSETLGEDLFAGSASDVNVLARKKVYKRYTNLFKNTGVKITAYVYKKKK